MLYTDKEGINLLNTCQALTPRNKEEMSHYDRKKALMFFKEKMIWIYQGMRMCRRTASKSYTEKEDKLTYNINRGNNAIMHNCRS